MESLSISGNRMQKKLSRLRKIQGTGLPRFDGDVHALVISFWSQLVILSYGAFYLVQMTQFSHLHPRLLLCSKTFTIMFLIWSFFLLYKLPYQQRCRGRLRAANFKLLAELNFPLKRNYPILYVTAKTRLIDGLDGAVVKTGSTRPAFWRLTETGADILTFVLEYDHTTLGTKISQLYRRRLSLDVHVKSKGINTQLELTYAAQSAMDYQTVHELIHATDQRLKEILIDKYEASPTIHAA